MLEFIFFDENLKNQFCNHLQQEQIAFSLADDAMGQLVAVDLLDDDPQGDLLDELYDTLMEQQEALLQQEDEEGTQAVTALTIHLQDGETVYANIDAELMNRLMAAISVEEISTLVDAITSAVEKRDTRPLCKR